MLKSGDKVFGFLDDNPEMGSEFCEFPVLGSINKWMYYKDKFFFLAIGNPQIREKISNIIQGGFYTAIHPSAQLSCIDVKIDEGTVVMANTVISSGAPIRIHCIINSSSVVEHDTCISDFAHISVGAKVAGTVCIGIRT